jgi:hypothetical protein
MGFALIRSSSSPLVAGGVVCDKLFIARFACSLHSRWATIGLVVVVCGNISSGRESIVLPHAAVGARSGNVDGVSILLEYFVG